MTDPEHSIVAIANNAISGRGLGAPLTNKALAVLRDRSYEVEEYRVHEIGLSLNGKELRSNTLFIKQDGKLIGMLSILFDDSRYRELAEGIRALSHPDLFLNDLVGRGAAPAVNAERYSSSTEATAADAVRRQLDRLGLSAERLNQEERISVISALEEEGIFLLKGVVRDVAAALHCSSASVYRYLAQIKNGDVAQ